MSDEITAADHDGHAAYEHLHALNAELCDGVDNSNHRVLVLIEACVVDEEINTKGAIIQMLTKLGYSPGNIGSIIDWHLKPGAPQPRLKKDAAGVLSVV